MVRLTDLAVLREIKKKDEEWQQKLKTFKEILQKIGKDQ